MMRFTQEMGQRETDIEGGISEMNHFVIEQNQFSVIDQRVLRAEIAVHKTIFVKQGFLCERVEKRAGIGYFVSSVKVIRFQAQALKVAGVCKRPGKFIFPIGGLAVNGAEQ